MLPRDSFREEFELASFSSHSGKKAVFYGENWLQVITDGDEVGIILLADLVESESLSIELYPDAPQSIAIISSDDWIIDVVIPIDFRIASDRRKKHYSICFLPTNNPVDSYKNTLIKMESIIKSEMSDVFSYLPAEQLSRYIEKRYPAHIEALMNAGELSNVTPYLFKKDFSPSFIGVRAIRHE